MTKIILSGKPTGWHKDMPVRKRRRLLLRTANSRNFNDKRLEVARRMQALANLSTDHKTKVEASKDARYFFELYQKYQNK